MDYSLQFRGEVLNFLLPLFPPLESKSSHAFAITRILVTLSNPCGTSVQISCAGRNAIGVPTHIRSCRGRRRRVKPTRDDRRTRFGRRLNIRAGPCRFWSSTHDIGRDVKSCLRDELNSASNKVIQHGAPLGVRISGMGGKNEQSFEDLKQVLYKDSVVADEVAGYAMAHGSHYAWH